MKWILLHADFANSSWKGKHISFLISDYHNKCKDSGMQHDTVSTKMSTCNNVTSIVYDLYRVFLYTQFMDVSGWVDFPKINGTSGIRKVRKLLCRCDPKNICSVHHRAVLHRAQAPSTESTGWLASTAPGQTHYSAISEVCLLSTAPGNLYHFLHTAVWLPNKDVSP